MSRLILVAEKEMVYTKYPIPLINRLEKHCVVAETVLTEQQSKVRKELIHWVNLFTSAETDGLVMHNNNICVAFFIHY